MFKYLSIISLFVFSTTVFAQINFIQIKDEVWKLEVINLIDKINQNFSDDWTSPKEFNIAYVKSAETSYYPIYRYTDKEGRASSFEKLLILGDKNEAKFVHEYGHLVLDDYMREESKLWQLYLISQKINFKNIAEIKKQHEELIVNLQKINIEYVEKRKNGDHSEMVEKIINNTSLSLRSSQLLVKELKQAQAIEEEFPLHMDVKASFKLFLPYSELFADTLAAIVFQDWSIMKSTTKDDVDNKGLADRLLLPELATKQESIQAYLEHRDFIAGLYPDSYPFQDWQEKSPYMHFAPTRSFIRGYIDSEKNCSDDFLVEFVESIVGIYDENLIVKSNTLNLKDKNSFLIKNLQEKLSCMQMI